MVRDTAMAEGRGYLNFGPCRQSSRELLVSPMKTSELAYPAVALWRDGSIEVAADETTLRTMTAVALRRQVWRQGLIVDSNGAATKVNDAKFVSGRGSFWGYNVFLNRAVLVDFALDESSPMTLEELRKRLLPCIRRGSGSIDAESAREQVGKVKEAQTARELIKVVLPIFDMREFWRRFKRL